MTEDHDRKKLVRVRVEHTGESYSAASAQPRQAGAREQSAKGESATAFVDLAEDGLPAASMERTPLSALLSQVLVALTVETDNCFEQRMAEQGQPSGLSLATWTVVMRHAQSASTVRSVADAALMTVEQLKKALGCLERWGYVEVCPPGTRATRTPRDGWGSGRGIGVDCHVDLTPHGQLATKVWPPAVEEVERRWALRFERADVTGLRRALEVVLETAGRRLPFGLPSGWLDWDAHRPRPAEPQKDGVLPLVTLLSRALLLKAVEFDEASDVPLAVAANTLRVIPDDGVAVRDLPRLTGLSGEVVPLGWRTTGLVEIDSDPLASRGRRARLTPAGVAARRRCLALADQIEHRWIDRHGIGVIGQVRASLEAVLTLRSPDDRPYVAIGMAPPPGVRRAGGDGTALGRDAPSATARKRLREMAAQTQHFMDDPAGALPHYPLWDGNRGFGP